MGAKVYLQIFRHENSLVEPLADTNHLLNKLAEELGYKVYDGFKDDVLTCIKENNSEDDIINCIERKLKRYFEPEKRPLHDRKNDSVPPRRSSSIKRK
ncbi:MAG: hypothetical protein ACI9DK_003265 [Vicingaceae bacterium]|jgi:hypothetical protein